MKVLSIPFIKPSNMPAISDLSAMLDNMAKETLSNIPWDAFPYKPDVQFSIAHAAQYLLIKFYVRESNLRIVNESYNSPVYEDSCVEFFIQFAGDSAYYNLEMNAAGAVLLAYGPGREDRKFADATELDKIERQSLIRRGRNNASIYWELTAVIPVSVFTFHDIDTLSGKTIKGNVYKCGDLLPVPHFISWNNILSPQPDFHLPAYFGVMECQ